MRWLFFGGGGGNHSFFVLGRLYEYLWQWTGQFQIPFLHVCLYCLPTCWLFTTLFEPYKLRELPLSIVSYAIFQYSQSNTHLISLSHQIYSGMECWAWLIDWVILYMILIDIFFPFVDKMHVLYLQHPRDWLNIDGFLLARVQLHVNLALKNVFLCLIDIWWNLFSLIWYLRLKIGSCILPV